MSPRHNKEKTATQTNAATQKHLGTETQLAKEVAKLAKIIERLEDQKPFDIMSRPRKFMWFSFLKGLMAGLGSVIGATLLVALLIYILKQIQLIPLVGDFIGNILEYIGKR